MKRFRQAAKAAGWALGALSGIAGLTLATTGPAGKPWTAWGVGALSIVLLVFLIGLIWPELQIGVRRIRDYPASETRAEKLQDALSKALEERDEARGKIAVFPDALSKEREIGRLEIIGSMLALLTPLELHPVAATVVDEGLTIIAESSPAGTAPPIGSRYMVQTAAYGSTRGVLSVVGIERETGRIHLAVAETSERSATFWENVKLEAENNERAPEVKLVPDTRAQEIIDQTEGKWER